MLVCLKSSTITFRRNSYWNNRFSIEFRISARTFGNELSSPFKRISDPDYLSIIDPNTWKILRLRRKITPIWYTSRRQIPLSTRVEPPKFSPAAPTRGKIPSTWTSKPKKFRLRRLQGVKPSYTNAPKARNFFEVFAPTTGGKRAEGAKIFGYFLVHL